MTQQSDLARPRPRTGDVVDGKEGAARCCEILQREGIVVACGNHDRWVLQAQLPVSSAASAVALPESARAFLAELPVAVEIETVGGPALLCHGLGEDDKAQVTPDDYGYATESQRGLHDLSRDGAYRYVIAGHTHCRMVRSFGELTIINPGTLLREQEPGFAVANCKERRVQFFDLRGDEISAGRCRRLA